MQYIELGSNAYRRIFFSMLLGSTVTFAILYGPQTLIHIFPEQFNIPPSTASLIISFATVGLAIGMLFITVFSNAWGRKKVMTISLILASALNILLALSPNFNILSSLRFLQGFILCGFPSIALTYLSEEISPEHVGRVIGIYVSGSAVGGFIGRVIISSLTSFFTWNIAVLVLGVFSMFCSILFAIYLPESRNLKHTTISFDNLISGMVRVLKNKKLFYMYTIGFLLLGTYVALFNYIGFPLSKSPYHLSQSTIGLLFIFQLCGSWGAYFFGKLTEKYSRVHLIFGAITVSLIGAIMTISSSIFVLSIGLILFATGFFAGHSITSGWIGVISPPDLRVYSSSIYLFFYYIGSTLIGWYGGMLLSLFGWSGMILMICGLLTIIGLLAFLIHQSLGQKTIENSI
ncbi:MFS transporter [Bacillus thuringiensis]|uniref:MFS transporter n=1 Tax=Bacillus thuringiensis TaxID=1428 RepID=UPI00298C9558|nr:MFS transporter [Bacillus thuringiensis]